MTVRANKFTPEVLISAPRRSSAIPNSNGNLALFTVSTYSFDSHSKSAEIRVLDIKTGQSTVLSSDSGASEPIWLGDGNLVLWLQGGENGVSSLILGDADSPDQLPSTIGTIDGPVANLKVFTLHDSSYAITLTGQATPSGELYNSEKVAKPISSGRVYTSGFVRHWDAYTTENTNTIFYASLKKYGQTYHISPPGLINALKGSGSLRLESPVPPFGGGDDYDISKNGLVFIAKDPQINPATHTKTDLYYVPLKTFTETEVPVPQIIKTGNLRGYCASPVFSPDAKSVAFTRMKSDGYESDKPRLLLLPDITDLSNVQEFFETEDGNGGWDLRPGTVAWSQDGKDLYLTAEEEGRDKLWKVASSPHNATRLPTVLFSQGSVSDFKHLAQGDSKLLVSSSSLVDNSLYTILDPAEPFKTHLVSSSSKHGKTFGLSQDQVEDFWFQGGGDYKVHAWLVKPSNFDKSKRYPLAYLIHGGPQGAWNESWSTRWNPAVFAEQGYVVVTVNFSGSTGYGMEFQNAIKNNWGGRPYLDLVAGFDHIEKHIPYVDTDRAVALGASYGGYMVNFIQGNDFGRRFKCLVTHDGVFSTLNIYSTEELFFPNHEFGGTLWEKRAGYEKWDPAKYVDNWQTPHFIIHNELDYRLPINEGLAPFNVLQAKGIPTKFLTFPDENHWVLKPENSLVWHREVFEWINYYSGVEEERKAERALGELVIRTH